MKKTILTITMAVFCATSLVFASGKTENMNHSNNTSSEISVVLVNDFCMAIIKGDKTTVEKFIELGENVNQQSNGMTPAMYAARYNRTEILKALIQHGANLKTKSAEGHRALKYAELSGANEAAEIIKSHLEKK
ncbi:ankyrin repeat domain-containing protein [Ascidiimonas sp. W6]|uniref:ankyrin repeat domain-containing protein n=1 Tax=Ascidiimonas meishanensis TaxID=3128903 RepID=UPI0030EDA4AF